MAHLLIVDDDRDVLRLFVEDLSEDHKVTAVENGRTALARFEALEATDKVDLVLTDLIMPGFSGSVFASRLLKIRSLPILVISGADAESLKYSQEMVEKELFSEVLEKPITTAHLLERVNFYLNEKKVAVG